MVKIEGVSIQYQYPSQVRDSDKDGSPGQGQSDHPSGRKNQKPSQEAQTEQNENRETSPKKVEQAIQAYKEDSLIKNNGLNISVSGQGPGLRVVLKDSSGNIVRNLSADELIRLKESSSSSPDNPLPGKILDRKL